MTDVVRVVLVDDQDLVRGGIAAILRASESVQVVGQASDGPAGVAIAIELGPDVVLMDIEMPGGDGLTATRQILARCPATRVLMLTTFDLDEYIYQALRAGASGFLLKTTAPGKLAQAVQACAAGETMLSSSVTRQLVDNFIRRPTPQTSRELTPALRTLTPRELEVLSQVATGRSNAEVGASLYLSEATVKTHMSHILAKLDLRDRVQAVVLAYESGLVTPQPD
jgi:DNA-binding NarL/FixJ family response regulator